MTSTLRQASAAFTAAILVLAAACGGTSVSHEGAGGMAGMSASGGTGTSGGSSGRGGSSATGGSGGTTATGGTGGSGGTTATGGTGAVGGADGGTSGGGSAGRAGSSGSAGTGGTSCVPGDMCTTEGAVCQEPGCCTCSLACKGGSWVLAACPSCVAPICPQDPPSAGDVCSPCEIPAEGCTWDQRAVDGPLYTATCVNDRWVVAVQDVPTCCMTDAECAPGVCVNTECRGVVVSGECWRDDQCPDGQACSGARVCGCASDCSYGSEPGVCVPEGRGCCLSDQDCPAPSYCLEGVCKSAPTAGCWTDRECKNGGMCFGAQVCTCGLSCFAADSPGNCVYPL